MFSQMLCAVHAAMLSARATEREHQAGKPTLNISLYVMVSQIIYMSKECKNLTIVFQESDNGLVKPREFFIRLITPRIMR